MFLEAVLLGLLVGYLRGGRALHIGSIEFKGWVLVVVGFLLQMTPMLLGRMSWMERHGNAVAFLTLVLVFFIVVLNIDKKGFWLVALGSVFNILAMAFNGLKMPVSMNGLQLAGRTELLDSVSRGAVLNYVGFEGFTHWSLYLGKVVAMPAFYPFAQAITVGDLVMSAGLFLFVMGQMTSKQMFRARGRMVRYGYPGR